VEEFLTEYIRRIKPAVEGIGEDAGHKITSTLLAFRLGLYENAIIRSGETLAALESEDSAPPALKRALEIIRERTEDIQHSRVTENPRYRFEAGDTSLLAVTLPDDLIGNPDALDLDNALLLLYASGLITTSEEDRSEEDRQALEEHHRFAVQMLETYREKMAAQE